MKYDDVDIHIGTSGWSYPHWKGVFYPDTMPKSRWFEYYITHFRTVEINATFYRFFKDQTFQKWHDKAPDEFKYVLKTPRLITHRRYLINVEEQIKLFWRSATLLKEKLGMVLLQLPPSMPYDLDRLRKAILTFSDPRYLALEFRHNQYLTEETKTLLVDTGITYCNADSPRSRLNDWLTSDTAYFRLHGHESWYGCEYSYEELTHIKELIQKMINSGARQIYVFFNNDISGFAPKNALALIKMFEEENEETN